MPACVKGKSAVYKLKSFALYFHAVIDSRRNLEDILLARLIR